MTIDLPARAHRRRFVVENAPAALLLLLAGYGLFSLPTLAQRWGASPAGIIFFAGWAVLAGWVMSSIIRRPHRAEWAGFVAAVVALRIGSAMLAVGRVSPGDSQVYVELARNLLAGRGLVADDPYLGLPVHAFYPPLYPVLLAGWGAVAGLSTASLLALSTAIDLAAAWTIARLGKRLGEARAGIAAGALYLIWPTTLFSAPLAQKEGLAVLLATALATAWASDRRRALTIGVLAGLLALAQPGWATLALFFGLAMMPTAGWRPLLRVGIPASAVAAAVMLPWWLRNWLMFGAVVPLTSASGLSLWVGNNPAATGRWMPYPPELRGLPELAYARVAGGIAIAWMIEHPAACVRLTATKFVRALALGQGGIVRLAAMQPPLTAAASAVLLPIAQGTHTALLAASAIATRIGRGPRAFLIAGLAQTALVNVWFEFDERHREFLTPLLLLTVTSGVAALVRRRTAPAAASSARPAA